LHQPSREIERANLTFSPDFSADESAHPAVTAAEARPTIAHNGKRSPAKKGEAHGHFPLPRQADQLSNGGGDMRSSRRSNEGAEDAAIPRFRSFEKAGASILSPPVLRLSSLINLPARDAGCSSMPHGRHTARMEVCYEVTAGTGLPAADAL
jgi:hypothetical protein